MVSDFYFCCLNQHILILHEGRMFSHTMSILTYNHVPPILSQYISVLDDKFKAWAACDKISWITTSGQWTMSTSQKVNNLQLSETTAGINFHFAIVTEEEILQLLTCLECAVLLPSLYVLTPLFSSIMVNSCFWNTSHVPTNILPLFTLISENNCFLLLLLLLLLGQVKKKISG